MDCGPRSNFLQDLKTICDCEQIHLKLAEAHAADSVHNEQIIGIYHIR